jgi:hypothetical protein
MSAAVVGCNLTDSSPYMEGWEKTEVKRFHCTCQNSCLSCRMKYRPPAVIAKNAQSDMSIFIDGPYPAVSSVQSEGTPTSSTKLEVRENKTCFNPSVIMPAIGMIPARV